VTAKETGTIVDADQSCGRTDLAFAEWKVLIGVCVGYFAWDGQSGLAPGHVVAGRGVQCARSGSTGCVGS